MLIDFKIKYEALFPLMLLYDIKGHGKRHILGWYVRITWLGNNHGWRKGQHTEQSRALPLPPLSISFPTVFPGDVFVFLPGEFSSTGQRYSQALLKQCNTHARKVASRKTLFAESNTRHVYYVK